jgi:hypothetical protein
MTYNDALWLLLMTSDKYSAAKLRRVEINEPVM